MWVDLGECVSKSDHLQRTAMSTELRQHMHRVYLSKGAAATTAIEGNTLDEETVRKIADGGAPPAQKSYQKLHTEVENVLELFRRIVEDAQHAPLRPLTPRTLNAFQGTVLKDLSIDGNVGKVRERNVGVQITNYRGVEHRECEYLLQRLCNWLREGECFVELETQFNKKSAGIIRAIMVHLYIAWIHPYDDGNGRTARMAEFYSLIAAGIPDAVAPLLSNHCNRLRDEYYRQLALSSKTKSPRDFVCFMVRGLRDGLREQLKFVYEEHEKLVWRAVSEKMVTDSAKPRLWRNNAYTDDSRKRIISSARVAARCVGISCRLHIKKGTHSAEQLSADDAIIALYAGQKSFTALLKGDLQKLVEIGLVCREAYGFSANTAHLRELRPDVAAQDGERI